MHRALRILSTALITAGVVIFIDVGLTLAWREPVSSLYGSIKQSEARDQLHQLESAFPSTSDLRHVRHVHGTDEADRRPRDALCPQALRPRPGHR